VRHGPPLLLLFAVAACSAPRPPSVGDASGRRDDAARPVTPTVGGDPHRPAPATTDPLACQVDGDCTATPRGDCCSGCLCGAPRAIAAAFLEVERDACRCDAEDAPLCPPCEAPTSSVARCEAGRCTLFEPPPDALRARLDGSALVLQSGPRVGVLPVQDIQEARLETVPLRSDGSERAVFARLKAAGRPATGKLVVLDASGAVRTLFTAALAASDGDRRQWLALRLDDLDHDGQNELLVLRHEHERGEASVRVRRSVLRQRPEGFVDDPAAPEVLTVDPDASGLEEALSASLRAVLGAADVRVIDLTSVNVTTDDPALDEDRMALSLDWGGDLEDGGPLAVLAAAYDGAPRAVLAVTSRAGEVLASMPLGPFADSAGDSCRRAFSARDLVRAADWGGGARALIATWRDAPDTVRAVVVRWDGRALGPLAGSPRLVERCTLPPEDIVVVPRADGVPRLELRPLPPRGVRLF
jgi:hypothetical protein